MTCTEERQSRINGSKVTAVGGRMKIGSWRAVWIKCVFFMEGIVQSTHSPVQTTLFQEARVFGQ